MKITKFLLAMGMVLSANLAHASLGEGSNCAANGGPALTRNDAATRQQALNDTSSPKTDDRQQGTPAAASDNNG